MEWLSRIGEKKQEEVRYSETDGILEVDTFMYDAVSWSITDLYKDRGRIIRSLKEYEATAYYPFKESLSPTPHSLTIKIGVSKDALGLVGYAECLNFAAAGTRLVGKDFDPQFATSYDELYRRWPIGRNLTQLTKLRMNAYTTSIKHEASIEVS